MKLIDTYGIELALFLVGANIACGDADDIDRYCDKISYMYKLLRARGMNTAKKLRLEGRDEGLNMGRSEGIASEKRCIATNLLSQGLSTNVISKALGVDPDRLEALVAANDPVFSD